MRERRRETAACGGEEGSVGQKLGAGGAVGLQRGVRGGGDEGEPVEVRGEGGGKCLPQKVNFCTQRLLRAMGGELERKGEERWRGRGALRAGFVWLGGDLGQKGCEKGGVQLGALFWAGISCVGLCSCVQLLREEG